MTVVSAGLFLFVSLFLATLFFCIEPIENDLTQRSSQALSERGLTAISVDLDGRDATLGGVTNKQVADDALALVASVWGVRMVASDIDWEAEEARLVEEVRKVETARRAQEKRVAEQARLAEQAAANLAQVSGEICQKLFNESLADEAIQFDVGSAVIQQRSFELLHNLSVTALRCPETHIEIVGHTDSTGDQRTNINLSFQRAEAVLVMLVRSGVASSRLTALGYGSAFPVASNDTPEGRARNRRIEFNVSN